MRSFRPTLVACAMAFALSAGTASAQFTNAYTFGDSLSDAGQFGARFTTNPGLTAPMYVGENWGITSTPSFTGGNDYALGGARINSPQGGLPPGVPDLSVADQVHQYLSQGPVDRNALFQIQGGANDIRTQFTLFATGQITQAQMQANVAQAASDLAVQVGTLKAAGAQYVIVQAVPDIGKTPAAASLGPQAQAGLSALSGLFNSTLNAAIGQANINVIQFNTSALLSEIIAQPALYGFTNTTGVACTTSSSLDCTPSTLVAPNANIDYVFADSLHPTTGANLVLASAMQSMITGPMQMAALGEAPTDVERANWRALDGRMMSAINAPGVPGKLQAWAAYDYTNADIHGTGLSGSGDLNTISVGADMRVTDKMAAGVQFAYTDYNGDFGNGGGDFKLREPMLTAYGGYGEGPWYLGATLGLGALDYSTTRNIQLGATTRTESGDTSGYHVVGRLLGGYWFRYRDWDHGPFAKLTYNQIVVRQFSESGIDSTALTYNQQSNDSFWSSVGWQVAGVVNGFRPFARATWDYNFQGDTRQVTAKANGLNGWYKVPGFEQDDNFWLFDLGVSRDFGRTTGFLSGNVSAGKDDGDYWAVTVGIRVPL
ncbi:MAG: autotransporter domain-containing protein [Burkholderiales bacterium]|nr:autotransporter domain-containing protein [Burkholderiales bacterium]